MSGNYTFVRGFITDEKYLLGQDLTEIERRLGFQQGRLKNGANFIKIAQYPRKNQFTVRGYSQVAGHHFNARYGQVSLDLDKLKGAVLENWIKSRAKLIKVDAAIKHDGTLSPDAQYPPGSGIPQWELTQPVQGWVVKTLDASDYINNVNYT